MLHNCPMFGPRGQGYGRGTVAPLKGGKKGKGKGGKHGKPTFFKGKW